MTTSLIAADGVPTPPIAKAVPKTTTLHGVKLQDPYAWLREKTNPEVIGYLQAENQYTQAVMKDTGALQAALYKEILGRIKETDLSVPAPHGGYFYYTRTEKGKQYAIYCRKKGTLEAPEEVLLDGNELAVGHNYFRVGRFLPSPNHKLLAYSVDTEGDEAYTIRIKDLSTGQLLPDQITNSYYSVEWAEDNKTLFYNVLDEAKRPYKLFRHTLGGKPGQDALVYHEPDALFTLEFHKTRSGKFLLIDIESSTSSEVRYLPADKPMDAFQVLEPRRKDIRYFVEHHGESFYIRADDRGRNYRLVKAPAANPGASNWTEVIPHRPDVLLEGVEPFKNHLVIETRENGLRSLRIDDFATHQSHMVRFDEPTYNLLPAENREFDTNQFRFAYTSLITPMSVYDYDMNTRKRDLKKRTEVLGGYDPEKYQSERVYATAPDGVKIPISLVYRKGIERNGKNPALLYGYGAYGIPSDAGFVSDRLSLLDRGFVYAIAHIRGGSEMGRIWHDDGKMMKKKNTFSDFISAAEYLIAARYTSKDHLAILGGSAGGMLMGAVVNRRPDLFAAVVAKVPFVDVMNTMLDETLPLTVGEFEEWGNPKEQQYFEYILSYSPYDNVGKKAYPNMLITAGLNDPRVSYWEPAKWTAKLRTMKTDNNILLLKTEMGSGHFGSSGRYEKFKETAFEYAFLLKVLGVQ